MRSAKMSGDFNFYYDHAKDWIDNAENNEVVKLDDFLLQIALNGVTPSQELAKIALLTAGATLRPNNRVQKVEPVKVVAEHWGSILK